MVSSLKYFIIFSLTLLHYRFKAQNIGHNKIEHNAKFICFSDLYSMSEGIVSDSSLLYLFHEFDKKITISYPKSKGFTLAHDTMFFISVFFSNSNISLLKNDSIEVKRNLLSNFCEYIICCIVRKNSCTYYKIKGFQVNEYSLMLNELLNQYILNEKEVKNSEQFCYKHQIEGIDIKCLHSKYLKIKNNLLNDCCISCLNRERIPQIIYLLEGNRKIYNETKDKLKLAEGYFIYPVSADMKR